MIGVVTHECSVVHSIKRWDMTLQGEWADVTSWRIAVREYICMTTFAWSNVVLVTIAPGGGLARDAAEAKRA